MFCVSDVCVMYLCDGCICDDTLMYVFMFTMYSCSYLHRSRLRTWITLFSWDTTIWESKCTCKWTMVRWIASIWRPIIGHIILGY